MKNQANPEQFSLWANILDKFLPTPKKQKFPLEQELNTINRILTITQNHLNNPDYLPTPKEVEFLHQLSHELWKNYLVAKQASNETHRRLNKGEEKQMKKTQIDDNS